MYDKNKKNILIFVPEFPRKSETFIERDISKLIEFGNLNVMVFSLATGTATMSDNVREVTHYKRISLSQSFVAGLKFLFLHPFKFFKVHSVILEKDGLPYFAAASSNSQQNSNDLRAKTSKLGKFHNSKLIQFLKAIAYADLFKQFNPDEIHAHFFSDSSNIAMLAAMILDVPFSINAHAKDVLVEPSLPKAKAKYSKFITVCNKNAYQELLKLVDEKHKDKVMLLYHGLDKAKLFNVTTSLKKPVRPTIFMGGTRLVEKKGIKYVLEASKLLHDRGFDHELHVVGLKDAIEPDEYDNLLNRAKSFGIAKDFFIHGEGNGLPFEQVAPYYLISDIFVLHNIHTKGGDADGIPNTLIEAALAKLPIVTTNAGSITELIDGENGYIVEQMNYQELAGAIEKLILNPQLRAELGQKAHDKAVQMFDAEFNVKKLEKALLN